MEWETYLHLGPAIAGLTQGRVCPGWDWDAGGFVEQNKHGWGSIVVPDHDDCKDWVSNICGYENPGCPCHEVGCSHFLGGWWHSRSLAVKWDNCPEPFYYRAGDDGYYDLFVDLRTAVFDFDTYWGARVRMERLLQGQTTRHNYEHILKHELELQCKGLVSMLLGRGVVNSVADVWAELALSDDTSDEEAMIRG